MVNLQKGNAHRVDKRSTTRNTLSMLKPGKIWRYTGQASDTKSVKAPTSTTTRRLQRISVNVSYANRKSSAYHLLRGTNNALSAIKYSTPKLDSVVTFATNTTKPLTICDILIIVDHNERTTSKVILK